MGKTNEGITAYDTLTGLPKVNLFKSRINELIQELSGKDFTGTDQFAVVFLNIDNYRYLKEIFGTKISNEVIKHVADYLMEVADDTCFVSRTADDKFALICSDIRTKIELVDTVEKIIHNVCYSSPSKYIYYVTLNAGIAMYPNSGRDTSSLMQCAETATYSAKLTGKDIKVYSDELQEAITSQIQMVNRLRAGIEREEFTLYYQPEYKLDTIEIIGVEALVRWPQSSKGFISPEKFIPVAEKSKQIYALERWIVNTALQQKLAWERQGLNHIDLSINLSSETLESESNFRIIEEIISSYQVDYTKITFEITETAIITNVEKAIKRLSRLRRFGIKIALDDFGTGYYSLTHLLKFPIDIIKIDKSFIKSIPDANEETVITKNILAMAQGLNYRVVAEGIETQEQLEYLRQNSCERGQGYLLCTPLPAEKISELLRHKGSI